MMRPADLAWLRDQIEIGAAVLPVEELLERRIIQPLDLVDLAAVGCVPVLAMLGEVETLCLVAAAFVAGSIAVAIQRQERELALPTTADRVN